MNPEAKNPIVYVIGKEGIYKIGCTSNILNRYNSKAMRADLILQIPVINCNMYELESKIHRLFWPKGTKKQEIFALDESDLELLREIAKAENPLEFVQTRLDAPKP